LWVAVADTYDAHALVPLWIWTADLVKQQAREGVADWQIIHAVSHAMAVALRCCGGEPGSYTVQEAYDRLPADVGWLDLQDAVERLAQTWEAIP